MTDDENENKRLFLTQARESERFQDGLRWSRIKTAALIEGAMLAAVYSDAINLGPTRRTVAAFFGVLLVGIVCALAVKDGRDARNHLAVIKRLEAELNCPPWPDTTTACLTGRNLLIAIIALVSVFNLLVLFDVTRCG